MNKKKSTTKVNDRWGPMGQWTPSTSETEVGERGSSVISRWRWGHRRNRGHQRAPHVYPNWVMGLGAPKVHRGEVTVDNGDGGANSVMRRPTSAMKNPGYRCYGFTTSRWDDWGRLRVLDTMKHERSRSRPYTGESTVTDTAVFHADGGDFGGNVMHTARPTPKLPRTRKKQTKEKQS
jgi:hypothetical protein